LSFRKASSHNIIPNKVIILLSQSGNLIFIGGDPMVGDRIRKLRTQQKLSQKELARKLDVSVATIKNWENDSSDPCLENIRTLSSIFNVTTDYLLGKSE